MLIRILFLPFGNHRPSTWSMPLAGKEIEGPKSYLG